MSFPESVTAAPVLARPILPDHLPTFRHLDPAAALAFRTPLQEHPPAADTKAGATLTALGIMFPLLARFDATLGALLSGPIALALLTHVLLIAFAVLSAAVVVQAFRTFSPRFPRATPTLAFFRDIATMTREDYIATVCAMSHDEALAQICAYNHNLSRICVEKFRQLHVAIRCFQGASAAWLVLMALLIWHAHGV
jgi:hypothetical protein